MTFKAVILFSTLFWATNIIGQTRTLTGKIIDQELYTIPQVKIFNADTVLLTSTDINGNFSVTVNFNAKSLIIADVGM